MNNQDEYKYDVAFSFLDEDRELATKINDQIKGRLNTFIYTETFELNTIDGEVFLNEIFSKKARVVAVLYRNTWGEKGWTAIEKKAIRNRAFEVTYDFSIFITIEPNPVLPPYIPKTHFWYGIDRWGIEGVSAVIEAHVKKSGGTIHQETALDKAMRLNQKIEVEEKRAKFLSSQSGVEEANKQVNLIISEIETKVHAISSQFRSYQIDVASKNNPLVLHNKDCSLVLNWDRNTLESYYLLLRLFDGFLKLPGYVVIRDPNELQKEEFHFDLNSLGKVGWIKNNTKKFYTSSEFADYCLKKILEQIDKKIGKM